MKNKDLLKKILFVVFVLLIFRVAAHIPIPGPESGEIKKFLTEALGSNSILSFLDIFSGGGISRFSIVMLGLGPYITASIMIQLLTMVFPKLEQLSKEGEEGRNKINQYSRILALPLAFIEGYAGIRLLQYSTSQAGTNFLASPSIAEWAMMLLAIAGGTMFLMWLGELITEKGLGNGVSIIIFAGIVAGLPQTVGQAIQKIIVTEYDPSEIVTQIFILAAVLLVIVAVIFITEGQRRLTISYAKRMRGAALYGGIDSFLPVKLNMSGVIPIIFAGAFMNIPSMIGFFSQAKNQTIARAATWVQETFNQQGIPYAVFFFILVFSFTFFSTFLYFKPKDVAENLQKHGGFIPGIRPGNQTEKYLTWLINRITLWGAIFLSLIAVMPFLIQIFTSIDNVMIGGTGLLIVVGVAIEMKNQIEAQIVTRNYEAI
ncbi:MAG: preprotein translocase subunit SecY [Patescibacteria group bacterium]|nr:preprotein translocase subunit SecY [Patescibacteria group bacterium]